MDRILIFSADGHSGCHPDVYRDYIEERYLEDLDRLIAENDDWVAGGISQARFSPETLELIDEQEAIRSGGELGAWDFDRRLQELDREGVAGELLIPGHQLSTLPFFGLINRPYPPDLRAAGARAYHRQLADAMAGANGRLYGVADAGPCLDMDETLRELRWAAEHGFVAVTPPGNVADPSLPPLHDEYFEPFWATCVELGLTLTAHAGYGLPQFGIDSAAAEQRRLQNLADGQEAALKVSMVMDNTVRIDQMPPESFIRLALAIPRRLLWQLMLGGVFDRYPTLKIVLTEVRADWVPWTIDYLDRAFADGTLPLKARPTEYWQQHCGVAPSSPRTYEVGQRKEIGVQQLLFGMDYPHPEGTWPNTREWIRTTFQGVDESDARLILGENALAFYPLDKKKLAQAAEKVGPLPSDVLGEHAVEPRLLEQFHDRSGCARPQEQLDSGFLDLLLSQDLGGLATSSAGT
jgi:predicted TIM-barrel fold metal-dependent hydrolase